MHAPVPSQYAPPQPLSNLSYRVRGGPTSGPLSNTSQNSLQSSGGWVVPAEEDAAAAEEQLKQELKKAKVQSHIIYLALFSVLSSLGDLLKATDDVLAAYFYFIFPLIFLELQKKIKKQQKMQEWQRIKDDKLRAEQEAEAAQRAAAEEAGMCELSFFLGPFRALTTFSNSFFN